MRKFLLLSAFASVGLLLNAQKAYRDVSVQKYLIERPMVQHQNAPSNSHPHVQRSARAGSGHLNSQKIGTAGNMLTIINGGTRCLDALDSLNAVTFTHRNDPTNAPGTNVAEYRFDISKDRGNNWTSNIGPITNNDSIDNVSVNGRFPQGLIYSPTGNTLVDSAYLVYSGTWHNSPPSGTTGSWQGQMRGRGKLSGDTSTFNVHFPVINNGQNAVATGMCNGVPGTFWLVNEDFTGTFATTSNQITQGIIVHKGVWNNTTKDVDWTEHIIPQTFVTYDPQSNGVLASVATSFRIAFDPTGQKGWIACIGDINADQDSVYDPIFWKTTDGGNTWTGPIWVDLDSIQGIPQSLSPLLLDGTTPASLFPSTAFEADLSVDVNGNPHFLTTVGSGTEYSIEQAGYGVWDITYDANAIQGCNWQGIHLADIVTLRGTFSSDNPAETEDNRPLISRSPDGHKLYFFWLETDFQYTGTADNDLPNLFGRAIDVVSSKMTPIYNFTVGDSLWGGETLDSAGGVFGGATYPTVSQRALPTNGGYNIPLVLTEIDYLNFTQGQLGSDQNPAQFWYINNVNVANADFTAPLDQVAPSITLNGPDTIVIAVNTPYTEYGATAFDCHDGNLTPVIQNAPDTSSVNIYNELYIATDAAGNSDTVSRVVIVGAAPIADFQFDFPQVPYRARFTDHSANFPTEWHWTFGDGTGSTQQNPQHTYQANGVYHVCLYTRNSFGTSTTVCKDVTISGVGINEVEFANSINMFPNPTSGQVHIEFNDYSNSQYEISVTNVLGATVVSPMVYGAGSTSVDLNLNTLSSGVYFVKIQNEHATAVKQLTITRK